MMPLRVAAAVIRPGAFTLAKASLGDAPFEAGYAAPTSARAILLTRRKPGKRHAGQWELPGGKLEPGEDGPTCLVRELAEELGVTVTIGPFVMEHVHDYGSDPRQGGQIALAAWEATLTGGRWALADHDRLAWVDPTDLAAFDLAAADIPIARHLAGVAP